jgi:hypothetical protein
LVPYIKYSNKYRIQEGKIGRGVRLIKHLPGVLGKAAGYCVLINYYDGWVE